MHCRVEDSRSQVRAKFCSLVTARAAMPAGAAINIRTCNTTRDYMDSNPSDKADQVGGCSGPESL